MTACLNTVNTSSVLTISRHDGSLFLSAQLNDFTDDMQVCTGVVPSPEAFVFSWVAGGLAPLASSLVRIYKTVLGACQLETSNVWP